MPAARSLLPRVGKCETGTTLRSTAHLSECAHLLFFFWLTCGPNLLTSTFVCFFSPSVGFEVLGADQVGHSRLSCPPPPCHPRLFCDLDVTLRSSVNIQTNFECWIVLILRHYVALHSKVWHSTPISAFAKDSISVSGAPSGALAVRYLFYKNPCSLTPYKCPVTYVAPPLGPLTGETETSFPVGPFLLAVEQLQ